MRSHLVDMLWLECSGNNLQTGSGGRDCWPPEGISVPGMAHFRSVESGADDGQYNSGFWCSSADHALLLHPDLQVTVQCFSSPKAQVSPSHHLLSVRVCHMLGTIQLLPAGRQSEQAGCGVWRLPVWPCDGHWDFDHRKFGADALRLEPFALWLHRGKVQEGAGQDVQGAAGTERLAGNGGLEAEEA